MSDSFPRLHARTQRFTLGAPRDLAVSADGGSVTFLRSPAGDDPTNALWVLDVATGSERLIADPLVLLGDADEVDLPPAERARRERAREGAAGVVGYATDRAGTAAAFALAGRLWLADTTSGTIRELPAAGAVFDPRPDPSGRAVAYASGDELRAVGVDERDRLVVADGSDTVSWGTAEFIAAEEMGRSRGFWWAPEGDRLAVARVDVAPVGTWYLADPTVPDRPPSPMRYPAAGTANADVSLAVLDALGGGAVPVEWDRRAFPYLVDVSWTDGHPLTLTVQSRDQRRVSVLTWQDGEPDVVATFDDPTWVEIVDGVPCWWDDRLVMVAERMGTRRLLVDGEPVTPDAMWVRGVAGAGDGGLVFTASTDDPAQVHVYALGPDGTLDPLTTEPGVHRAAVGGATTVVVSACLEAHETVVEVRRPDGPPCRIGSRAAVPPIEPAVRLHSFGERRVPTAVLFPGGEPPGAGTALPVLLDPYGGPHAQRVVRSRAAYTTSQWFADQGFVVVVADGRGTPGRGGGWEQAVWGDLAGPVLADQIGALHGAASTYGCLDLDRVGIRGWSFGGYLAALAVMRRPDVFHAAVAGAPVTDWRLYDTHYTERYLGHPDEHPEHYERTSLLTDAPALDRPLMLIHGLADDNVVSAHTLQLSRALLEAGRPHTVLPLSGVSHMTPQEVVAENLLLVQVEFLQRSLGVGPQRESTR